MTSTGISVIGPDVSTTPADGTTRDRWTEAANRSVLLDLVRDKALDVDALVTDTVSPPQAAGMFTALAERPDALLGVLID